VEGAEVSRTRRTQELLLVVGGVPAADQHLEIEPEDGRPSAIAQVRVWTLGASDTSDPEDATTGVAAIDTNPNTTLAAAAGRSQPDPTALTLTLATGVVVGRRYLLADDNTQAREWVEVAEANGTAVRLRHPLINDYSIGATFVTARCTIQASPSWLAQLATLSPNVHPAPSYRVKWEMTVGGQPRVYVRGLDVVMYPASHGVTPLDVDDRHPGFLDRLPPNHTKDQGRTLIEAAYADVVREMRGDRKADQSLRDPELVADLVIARVHLNLLASAQSRGADVTEATDAARDNWRQTYDQAIRSDVAAVDVSGGGAATSIAPTPLFRRCR